MLRLVDCALITFAMTAHAVAQPVILTVTGAIEETSRTFTLGKLEALGTRKIETSSPWFDHRVEFEGVPLARLLDEVGATGTILSITALNDYVAEVPLSDAVNAGALLALKSDGVHMSVSDKGPIFLVYPYDDNPVLQTDVYYSRSVWQIATIDVR